MITPAVGLGATDIVSYIQNGSREEETTVLYRDHWQDDDDLFGETVRNSLVPGTVFGGDVSRTPYSTYSKDRLERYEPSGDRVLGDEPSRPGSKPKRCQMSHVAIVAWSSFPGKPAGATVYAKRGQMSEMSG